MLNRRPLFLGNAMNRFEESVLNYIRANDLLTPGVNVVLGVSGGADSICLANVLLSLRKELDLAIYVVHVNHMIRGDEADSDQAYVESYCLSQGVSCKSYRIDVPTYAKEHGLTLEEAGRHIRYDTFEKAAAEWGLDAYNIAVAHNMNDVAETVILNMARGTGVAGMKGIAPKRGCIVRPLLGTSRAEIESYLAETRVDYRTDSTNLAIDYTRNKIRHNVLPIMNELNSKSTEHIASLAGKLSYYDAFVQDQVDDFLHANVEENAIKVETLTNAEPLISDLAIHQLIKNAAGCQKDIGEAHVAEVKKLYEAVSGSSVDLPYGVKVTRNYQWLTFEKAEFGEENASLGELGTAVFPPPSTLDLTKKTYTKYIDYDKIKGDVCLRKPQENDYMVINMEGGTKKLARLFSSEKIPQAKRGDVPVVAVGDEIIWAVGVRLSEAYKVTDGTTQVMSLECKIKE